MEGTEIAKIAREERRFLARALKGYGVGLSSFDLIHQVRKCPGISQAELASRLAMDKAAVARAVASLVRKGFLRKERREGDSRSFALYATSKAEELKLDKKKLEKAYMRFCLEALDEKEKETFLSLLNKVYLRSKKESQADFASLLGSRGE